MAPTLQDLFARNYIIAGPALPPMEVGHAHLVGFYPDLRYALQSLTPDQVYREADLLVCRCPRPIPIDPGPGMNIENRLQGIRYTTLAHLGIRPWASTEGGTHCCYDNMRIAAKVSPPDPSHACTWYASSPRSDWRGEESWGRPEVSMTQAQTQAEHAIVWDFLQTRPYHHGQYFPEIDFYISNTLRPSYVSPLK